jgi:hypothetical protein
LNELYHTDLGVRVRKVGESPSGKFIYVERLEDGQQLSVPIGELSLVVFDEDGLTIMRKEVRKLENLKLDAITFERGTAVPNEIGNLTGPTGELTKILQNTCEKIVALGYKPPTNWSAEAFGKRFSVQLGVHAGT